MLLGPRRAVAAVLFVLPTLTCQHPVFAQTTIAALPAFSPESPGGCRAILPVILSELGNPLRASENRIRCAEAGDDIPSLREKPASVAKDSAAIPEARESSDAVEAELLALGKRGQEILTARNAVLSILEGNNACSSWYREKDPDAVEMFRSLHFALDTKDSGMIHRLASPNQSWIFVQPYVARARQFVGPGSTITINMRGAFFEDVSGVMVVSDEGGASYSSTPRSLRVGDYSGGTQLARVLTILHEFGHVIDLLPLDAGFRDAPEVSVENTRQVVQHCKPEMLAAAKKSSGKPKKTSDSFELAKHQ